MTTAEVPRMYRRLATAIGAEHWQGAVARQEDAIRVNHFLGDYLRSEYAIAYQLDRLRKLVGRFGTVPHEACSDPGIFPSLAFAAQVLRVLELSSAKHAKAFVRRVRTALAVPRRCTVFDWNCKQQPTSPAEDIEWFGTE